MKRFIKRKKDANLIEEVETEIKNAEEEIAKEILVNVPNTITMLRLVFVFVFVYMLFSNYPRLHILFIFAIAAVTDWFDGFFARKLKQTSRFGARLDQVIDRIFTGIIVVAIIAYLYYRADNPINNIFLSDKYNVYALIFLCVSREIIGIPAVIIALFRKKGTYHVKYIGKVTTFIQSVAFGAIILGPILSFPIAVYLALITCFIGIFSGFDYLKYAVS
jgi:CDP-diacylglycerol---glycerol-3-phosphate 3-phosphatidyltransferase